MPVFQPLPIGRLHETQSQQFCLKCAPPSVLYLAFTSPAIYIDATCARTRATTATHTAARVGAAPKYLGESLQSVVLCYRQLVFALFTKSRASTVCCRLTMGSNSCLSNSSISGSRVWSPEHEPLFVLHPSGQLPSAVPMPLADENLLVSRPGYIHCCYTFAGQDTSQHVCVCWIDSSGYILDLACLPCSASSLEVCLQLIWEQGCRWRTRQLAESGMLQVAVVKWGDLSVAEVSVWERVILDEEMRNGCDADAEDQAALVWQRVLPFPATTLPSPHGLHRCRGSRAAIAVLCLTQTQHPSPMLGGGAEDAAESPLAVQESAEPILLVPNHASASSSPKAILMQTGLHLQLEAKLSLVHDCLSLWKAETDVSGSICRLLADVGREFHVLSWLTAVSPSGPTVGNNFAQRWSKLPLHCANVDRLARLVDWMFDEGLATEEVEAEGPRLPYRSS